MSGEGSDKKGGLLSYLPMSVLHESRSDSDKITINHLISRFLMVDQLIKRLECISAFASLKILLEEHLLELLDSPVEDGHRDLVWLDIARILLLKVWVPSFE